MLITLTGIWQHSRSFQMGKTAVAKLTLTWVDHGITKRTKMMRIRTFIFPTVTYTPESWT